jgi:hypothetical protein
LAKLRAAQGIGRVEKAGVSHHLAAWRRPTWQDETSGGNVGSPSKTLGGDCRRKAQLLVMPPKRLLDGHELGLDLDDQECPRRGVPRQQVHRTSLAVHGVRDLGVNRPASGRQQVRDEPDQPGMSFVDQPIQIAAPPAQHADVFGIEGRRDPLKSQDLDLAGAPSLDDRDQRLREPTSIGQVPLPPTTSLAERPIPDSEPDMIHRGRSWTAALT